MRTLFTPERIYCFDSSVLMQIAEDYPPDIFPTLWSQLEELIKKGVVHSVHEVLAEIEAGNDDLCDWAKRNSGLFISLELHHQQRAQEIVVAHPTLVDASRQTPQADPFIIAHSLIDGCVVVTKENAAQPNQKRKKIPDVCAKEGAEYINDLNTLFREFHWSF